MPRRSEGPLRIKVNHLNYRVLPLPAEKSDDGDVFGLHDNQAQIIYIEPSQTPAEQVRILCHELIHAWFWAYNIPTKTRGEENICVVLESPLAALFRDNPRLSSALAAAFAGQPIVA